MMRVLCGVLAALALLAPARADAGEMYRVSGPETYDNLVIFLIHGASAVDGAPLTLNEALVQGKAAVYATDNPHELAVKNLGRTEVLVSSGDMVTDGRQDRMFRLSLIVPPRAPPMFAESGPAPAGGMTPAVLKRLFGPLPACEPPCVIHVAPKEAFPSKIGKRLRGVSSPKSLDAAPPGTQGAYIAALLPASAAEDDIVGYAAAIDGRLVSADLYPSNAIFRRAWLFRLMASASQALAAQSAAPGSEAPTADDVLTFIDKGTAAPRYGGESYQGVVQRTRLDADVLSIETTRERDGQWLHRVILAR